MVRIPVYLCVCEWSDTITSSLVISTVLHEHRLCHPMTIARLLDKIDHCKIEYYSQKLQSHSRADLTSDLTFYNRTTANHIPLSTDGACMYTQHQLTHKVALHTPSLSYPRYGRPRSSCRRRTALCRRVL